jgi:hypothetical protein
MIKMKKDKRKLDKPAISTSTIFLLLALPLMIFVLQQMQVLKQHAQMTPPPAPPGCYYEPAPCSTSSECDPGSQKLVCPDTTPSPSPTPEQNYADQQNSLFNQIKNWFKNLF